MKFNWKKYCYINKLPSSSTKEDAYNHYLNNKTAETKTSEINHKISELFPPTLEDNKNILFLCHTIPTPDIDSGSKRIIELLKILIGLGYKIYYLTHDGQEDNSGYKDLLYSIGVERVSVVDHKNEKYCDYFIEKLCFKENIIFDVIIFEFYEMYHAYWDKIKYLIPNAKVIVDSVDVHWVRKLGNPMNNKYDLERINQEKNDEKRAYSEANVTFAVTEKDRLEIIKECPGANVKILSNIHSIHYSNESNNFIQKKQDLIFVGGDNHSPNTGAAKQAIKAFELFCAKYPEFAENKLHIVGKRSDKTILSYKNHNRIIIHGQIPQTKLDELYKTCLGAFCPIEWGSGIKGKVCEAISKNLPVITTSEGASGLDLIHEEDAWIANTTPEQIECIQKLFRLNKDQYASVVSKARHKLTKMVSKDMARTVLEGTLTLKPITISIVTHNNSYLLQKCLNSILCKTLYPNYKIHVTSNACVDDTPLIMKDYVANYSHITYAYNTENKHFIQAHNEAINLFANDDIVLLNEDIEILSSCWLSDLYSAAYSAGYVGCAGGKTLYPDGTICEAGAQLYNNGSGKNLGRNQNPDSVEFNAMKYVGYVSGCMMYMRRDCINKFGAMDMRYYPCYYEDSDWQYNLHIHGYKTVYTPKAVAIHREGSSCGTNIDNEQSFKRFMKINKIKFLDKYKNYNIETYNS